MSAAIAIAVFVVAYAFIATEKIPKMVAALVGAGVILAIGVVGSDEAFYSRDTGIDWDVIFLLLGMMIIVGILRKTGVFEYTAIWAAKRAQGSPLRVLLLLVLITALASAFLDNVTTVLLIAPVTLLVCDRLDTSPVAFLIAEVFASNIGGAATLIGDPPNIIIGSRGGLTFNDFLVNVAPIVLLEVAALALVLPWLFRGSFTTDPARAAEIMALDEREAIRDPKLLIKSGVVLAAVFTGFVGHSVFHLAPSVVALVGAGLLVLISGTRPDEYLAGVEWETLLFFAGLFVMIGALIHTGVIDHLARLAADATGGNALLATMLILFVSALLSGVVDNIPYVATMSPLVAGLAADLPNQTHAQALWWSLALGADFGGNLTAIGASANVVVLGIALRAGHPISFWEFTRKGAVVTAVTVLLAAPYLWLRYHVLA
ncbi:Na+/H+ antiporter NhaD/arsenite permease-like protein [Amycolatopsis bartoniae]|uniref:Membrane protein n=1 Tax=Amycolatopsis bartoniae TaxID=941986 RepID=A0A8H9MB20_9PSEU|nr:ArsB/NhaD family transporter [Amycolatopsis bartoniae]MBB2939990.1 Na+/H+ antiporter NhaD/arsenite permease-like protein [Amycolatopsis bartoniae]TVT09959.1 ArsB/NhaD family transporter [Amycolatopsis bartoniae]GHF32177.1 membrane protein [Amycolatopsis bartoniae]